MASHPVHLYPVHLSAALPLTFSWTALSAVVLVLYLGSKVARAVYNVFFSPLASIPGPPIAAVSNIWFEWNALRLRRTMAVHEAFERYGPIVRIGPNKLAVANAEEVREIYRSHKFRKSAWYDAIRFGGIHNSISTSDPEFHSMLRRWSAPAFRGDNLRAVSDALREEMQQFIDRIERETVRGEAIDMLHLFKLLSLDMLGIAVLGTQFDQMKTGQHHPLAHYLDEWLLDKTLENYMPSPIYWLLRRVPSARLQRIFAADENIFKLGEGIYDSAFEGEKANDIMSLCKSYRDPVTNLPPERRQILGEAAIFLSAGTDTTSVAVTYIAWALACNHSFSYEIRRELANVPDQKRSDIDVLKALPYLNAFIREVLRVHGPTPGFLERVVPPEGTCFQGHFIPGGTIVSGQSWTSHRDPLLYPDPLVIKPERWVTKVGDGSTAKRVAPEVYAGWFPFGQGPRACVGRPLAEIELLLVASTLARTFRLTPHASTTAESMSPIDMAVVGPAAMRCLLHFEPDPL